MGSSHLSPSLVVTTSLAQSVFQLCGTAGLFPAISIENGDFDNLVRAPMPDPLQYSCAAGFAYAYQSWSLLRKYSGFPIEIDRAAAALDGFQSSEVLCGQNNLKGDSFPFVPGVPLALQQQSYVELARGLIKRALGKFDWGELQTACAFSSGSSTRVPRKRGNAVFKLDGRPHVTINCRDLAVHFIWTNEFWRKYCQDKFGRESDPYSWVELVPGSRFDTVPKDSLTDRPICVEPDLNMFFQKGIGTMIRQCLRRVGINLNSQTRNQILALLGSIDGSLATIDLKSASDSVSLWVCKLLLPEDWYQAMLMVRSNYVLVGDRYQKLEKISSMGNGFTFELESLIFWAISKAVCIQTENSTEHLAVYGDDIIVPSAAAPALISCLADLGFQVNTNKTFFSGPFRESCGKHYFLGADVSPFKIVDPIETWADSYHFCNSLQEWGWADPDQVDHIITRVIKPIPPRSRCYVPYNFGSKTGLRVSSSPYKKQWNEDVGSYMYKFHYMLEVTNEHDLNGPCAYLAAMLQQEQAKPSVADVEYKVDRLMKITVPPEPSLGYAVLSRKDDRNFIRKTGWSPDWCDMVA